MDAKHEHEFTFADGCKLAIGSDWLNVSSLVTKNYKRDVLVL